MKYPNGSILMPSPKALRLHPNHFDPTDRFIVVGPATAILLKTVEWTDPYSHIVHPPWTAIDRIRRQQDSYVTLAPEDSNRPTINLLENYDHIDPNGYNTLEN